MKKCLSPKISVPVHPKYTEEESPSLKVWVPGHPRCTEWETPSFKSMGAWAPTMYRVGDSFFKSMGAWTPMTFNKGGCEKSFFENHWCQGTQDVRTVSFLTMYGEGYN